MPHPSQALAELIDDKLGADIQSCSVALGEVSIEVEPSALLRVAEKLRDEPSFAFEQVMDVCGVDYSTYGQADWQTSETASTTGFSRAVSDGSTRAGDTESVVGIAVVYHLLSTSNNQRLRIRVTPEGEPPRVPSVVSVWAGVNWFEREAFDLFGILFDGHPDLRRILSDYGFIGHPFRKDFPLSGHVEMRYDLDKQRVIYEPVSIEPRVLVPRVIRHDHRYEKGVAPEEAGDA